MGSTSDVSGKHRLKTANQDEQTKVKLKQLSIRAPNGQYLHEIFNYIYLERQDGGLRSLWRLWKRRCTLATPFTLLRLNRYLLVVRLLRVDSYVGENGFTIYCFPISSMLLYSLNGTNTSRIQRTDLMRDGHYTSRTWFFYEILFS